MDTPSANRPSPDKLNIPVPSPILNSKFSILNSFPRLWHTFKLLYLILFIALIVAISICLILKGSLWPTTNNQPARNASHSDAGGQLTTHPSLPTSASVTYTYPLAAISSWQSYQSPLFSLRYPPDWKTDADQNGNLLLISPAYSYQAAGNQQTQNINYMIIVYPFDFTTNTVDEAIAADYFRFTNTKNMGDNITRNPLTINSVSYQQIIGFPAEIFSVYFKNNQQIYRATLSEAGYGNSQFELLSDPTTAGIVNNFYNIISTVTTDKTLDTSSWEEYANNTYKFSVKLPSILGYGGDTGFGVYFNFPPEKVNDKSVNDSLYFIEATDSSQIRNIREKPKEGNIAGLPFWRESTAQTADSPSEIITYIARNDSLFEIMLRNFTGKYVGIYNRIISTLKFL